MARFEAVYYDGEDNERLPEWRVVEWNRYTGKTVWYTYDMFNGEAKAKEEAQARQEEYNHRFYSEFA